MKFDSEKLKTISNFGKLKNLSRQRIYILVESGKLDSLQIDGVKFIVMNKKAVEYKKKI